MAQRTLQLSFAGGEMSPEMFARYDDARLRSGAALVRNMTPHPRGSVARRPGFEHIRQCKTGATVVRLLPFRFSRDQTAIIEMGVWDDGGTDRGYFRFHIDGGTLMQQVPPNFQAAVTVVSVAPATEWINFAVGTNPFQTGDPVVFTAEPAVGLAVDTTNDWFTLAAHGFSVGDPIMLRTTGDLQLTDPSDPNNPQPLESGRIYYIVETPTADRFRIARAAGAAYLGLSGVSLGTTKGAVLPTGLRFNRIYYAVRVDSTRIQLALTKADAESGDPLNYIDLTNAGTSATSELRVHYAYRNGSVVFFGSNLYYLRKDTSWGTAEDADFINLNDHLEHSPGGSDYWVELPGSKSTVTFTLATDRVNWASHGLANGDPVIITSTGTLPTGITSGAVYYVRNKVADNFQVSATPSGPVEDLGGAPTGTATALANSFYEVPHDFPPGRLFEVNTTQSADVLTLVHPHRPPSELRRYSATDWRLADVVFDPVIATPQSLQVVAITPEYMEVTAVNTSTPSLITTVGRHQILEGQIVWLQDVGTISAGYYRVSRVPNPTTLELKNRFDGTPVVSGSTGLSTTPAVWVSGVAVPDDYFDYVVVAVDVDGRESRRSATFTVKGNMLGTSAVNNITWAPVLNAVKYRVYRKHQQGFGLVGEVEHPTTQLFDENFEENLAIAPPLSDESMRVRSDPRVGFTFDFVGNAVKWIGHGLEEGAPVVFDTDGTLPNELVRNATFFVTKPGDDKFQLLDENGVLVDLTGGHSGVHVAISGTWPGAVAYFEQRRVFAGAVQAPQDFWLTASGTESELSFHLPLRDSDRIHNRLAARERSQILHAVPIGHLVMLSTAAEFRLTSLDSEALTPASVSARAPTQIGAAPVPPVVVNNTILFVAARGAHLRELGFVEGVGDYATGDVALRASHLFETRTLVQLAYQQAPHPIVWAATSDGKLLALTYVPEEQIAGWHQHDIAGTIESCATVAEGEEDRLYVVTVRSGVRSIERLGTQTPPTAREDSFNLDASTRHVGAAITVLAAPHLAGQAVTVLADGVISEATADANGDVTLAAAATSVVAGLRYTSELQTLPLGVSIDAAAGSGRAKSINWLEIRLRNSGAFKAGVDASALSDSDSPVAGAFLDGPHRVQIDGDWTREGQLLIRTDDPLPLNITGLTLDVALGG